MRLSRANIPLASEDRTHSQAISTSPHNNLAPHFRPGFINLQHFCRSRWRNPVRLSKSGLRRKSGRVVGDKLVAQEGGELFVLFEEGVLEVGAENVMAALNAIDDGGQLAAHPAVHTGAEDLSDFVCSQAP